MGHHAAIPNDAGLPNPKLKLKPCWTVLLVLIASICSCSYNIYEAAHWGNTEKVIAYLESGADVNAPNRWGRTPLAVALFRRHYDTARLLIEKGARVDVVDPLRHVPVLLYPVIDGNLEMTRFLIDHGADVNLADPKGFTALIEAAYHGHTEIGRLLIEHGADIDAAAADNVTALSNARGRKNKAFEKMLADIIEQRERDELLFQRAKKLATIPAYEDYLRNFPKGKYAAGAREALDGLYFREATRLQTLEANQSYLRQFPNGKHSGAVKRRLDYLPLMDACLKLEDEKIDQLLSEGKSLKGRPEPAVMLMRLLQKQTLRTMRLAEFQVQELDGPSEKERLIDLEIFKRLLKAGADPDLMRIKGFQRAGRRSLDGVADLYSTGRPGKIVPAGEGGMSAFDFADANRLSGFKAYLPGHSAQAASAHLNDVNGKKNVVSKTRKSSVQRVPQEFAIEKKSASGGAGTIVTFTTRHFKKMKSNKCANYSPDYSKYHTIIHLLANAPLGTTMQDGKKVNAYIANTDGRDAITGQQRRISFSVDLNSFFSGAGSRNNPAKMRMRAGEPGTRITFDGDKDDPFEPVPGLRVWKGAIDIDPECGMVIRAKQAR